MTWMMGLDSKSLLSLVSGSLSPLVLLDRSVFVVFVHYEYANTNGTRPPLVLPISAVKRIAFLARVPNDINALRAECADDNSTVPV